MKLSSSILQGKSGRKKWGEEKRWGRTDRKMIIITKYGEK
jgi:hypothetical protein